MLNRSMLRWLAPLLMIVGVVVAAMLKERQVRTEHAATPEAIAEPRFVEAWESRQRLDVEGYPPKPWQVRYEHNMVAMRGSEVFIAYPFSRPDDHLMDTIAVTSITHDSAGQWQPAALQVVLKGEFPKEPLVQPTVAFTFPDESSGDASTWVACAELGGWSVVRLFYNGAFSPRIEPDFQFRGRNPQLLSDARFPNRLWLVLVNGNGDVEGWELDVSPLDDSTPSVRKVGSIDASPIWRTYQPPHAVVSPDGESLLVALKAEYEAPAYTDEKGNAIPVPAAGNVESEVWVYSLKDGVEVAGDAGSLIGERLRFGYHERPMLASDPVGGKAYCAIGAWSENPTDDTLALKAIGSETRLLRKYTLDVLSSSDGKDWSLVTRPLPEQKEVASAQPHLAVFDNHLWLLYAWDANLLAVENAHRLLMVESKDAGTSWSSPMQLTQTDTTTGISEEPLDIRLLLQPDGMKVVRTTWREVIPATSQGETIAVGESDRPALDNGMGD